MSELERETSSCELLGTRVLIVEDDPDIRQLMTLFLRRHGARVETASDGMEGLEKARQIGISAILLDGLLPYVDGWHLARRVREYDDKIPIIAVTGCTAPAQVEAYYERGCTHVLNKPFLEKDLIDALVDCLRQAHEEYNYEEKFG